MKILSIQWLWRQRWIAAMVVLPTLATAAYEGLFASDIYVSESRFVIKAPAQKSAQVSTLANLIQTTGLSGGQEQANEVIDYIRSRSALAAVNRGGAVAAMFGRAGVDALARYPGVLARPGREHLFRYYSAMINVAMNHETGLVVLKVKAFDPGDAQRLNQQLLGLSEDLVNVLNARAEGKQVAEAERRVAAAEIRVQKARAALGVYRNNEALIDPARQAQGALEVANRLVSEQAAAQAQLDQIREATPRNPMIPALQEKIAAMGRAVAGQNGRVMGPPGAIASKMAGYERLAQEQEFAAQNLNVANAALEQARVETLRQQYYLERVVDPALPDEPALPHRIKIVLTVLGASLCLYFVAWMFIVGILEHAPED
ncbi:capsular polysaccharide transport system permease protein [Novosphingobium sp. SG751A]|uniref:capsule biosynthesis protein n=1 Tax=Novosphingobium sp. SG751A TaxID=2587000 RepID=UPI0015571BD9|nr:capsule biosynthesis protein [Novosphingobium sp. SG751A]NOW44552.1 capsular polysaccharide transport system permease protein [Novosphingobium sp. SG751A]